MYQNLQAEFARCNIKAVVGIANVLECTEKSARNKLKGKTAIAVLEATEIGKMYFPDCSLDYLFATE